MTLFDPKRYPRLQRITHSEKYGRMELIEVSETSDGFLMGTALIGEESEDRYMHSIFLGEIYDWT